MKLETTLSKKELGKFLGVTNNKSPLPVLANLLIEADEGVTILATDLKTAIRQTFSANVIEKGKVLVNAKNFIDIVDRLTNDVMIVSLDNACLHITQADSKFKLPTSNVDDFPKIKDSEGSEFIVDETMLCQAIKSVVYAASSDSSRFNLDTVLADNGVFVATDGHRLSKYNAPFVHNSPLLMPSSSCYVLLKSLSGAGNCKVIVSDKFVRVEDDNVSVSVRLVDGEYPQWQKVIPTEITHTIKATRKDLLRSVKLVMPVVSPRDTGITVGILNNRIEVSKTSELGSACDSIPCEFDGSINFICNAKYLMECLTNIEDDDIIIGYVKDGSPIIITPITNETITHLVMPMRK